MCAALGLSMQAAAAESNAASQQHLFHDLFPPSSLLVPDLPSARAIASYVALSRITDNRHFLSDVVFGSALGIATGWTVVGRHGRENYAFLPVPVRGGIALTFSRVPRTAAATTH
jgi:hypothetical protein